MSFKQVKERNVVGEGTWDGDTTGNNVSFVLVKAHFFLVKIIYKMFCL